MKKLFLSAIMATTLLFGANAQTVITNDYGSPVTGADGQQVSDNDDERAKGGIDISYQAVDGGFGMGFSMVFNYLVFNVSWISGDTDKYIEKNEGWRAGVGLNYRHWLTDFLYIEGQAGVEYSHATLKMKGGDKNSDGDFGMFVTPRVGVPLLNIADAKWGIVAGYRWDFNKFKFSKEYTADYFTIGIVATL